MLSLANHPLFKDATVLALSWRKTWSCLPFLRKLNIFPNVPNCLFNFSNFLCVLSLSLSHICSITSCPFSLFATMLSLSGVSQWLHHLRPYCLRRWCNFLCTPLESCPWQLSQHLTIPLGLFSLWPLLLLNLWGDTHKRHSSLWMAIIVQMYSRCM